MDDLIATFHIDWQLMLAQLINFAIVVGILWKLLIKPLTAKLDQRAKEVHESLETAQRIKGELKELDVTKDRVITEAKREAQQVIVAAEAEAEVRRQQVMERVKAEAAEAVARARESFEAERESALRDLRREAAKLITQGVTRVAAKLPAAGLDQQYVGEVVEELTKRNRK